MNYKRLKETYVHSNKIGFIHITKTGGTNLKDKNRNRNIIYKKDHTVINNSKLPKFAIIRDPIDRYQSTFNYYLYGSDKYTMPQRDIQDINVFVDEHYKNPDFINHFEGGLQFSPQVSWLNGLENIYIVLYDKKNLIENIRRFLDKEFGIDLIYDNNEQNINTTKYRKNTNILTKESKNKIRQIYKKDIELYEKFVNYLNNLETNDKYCNLLDL